MRSVRMTSLRKPILINTNQITAHILLILIVMVTILNQRQVLADSVSFSFVILTFFLILYSLSAKSDCLIKTSFLNNCYLVLLLTICLSSVHYFLRDDYHSFLLIISSFYPYAVFIVFFNLFVNNTIDIKDILPYAFLILIFSCVLVYLNTLSFSEIVGYQARTNWANVVGSSLPLLFLLKNKTIRLTLLIGCSIILAIGLKRTGLIAVFFSFSLFFLFEKFEGNKAQLIVFRLISILLLILLCIGANELGVFDKGISRLTNLVDDGGAGRDMLLKKAWGFFSDSPFVLQMMGSGYQSFNLIENKHYSSHNDLADFLINYGVIGATILFIIYFRLLYICFALRKSKHFVFTLSVVFTFLLYSNSSAAYYYYYFFSMLFVYIAYIEVLLVKYRN
jgi:hypothetical protein